MSRGNSIIITSEPMGYFEEFLTKSSETIYPGMILMVDVSVSLVNGRRTAKIYDRSVDGEHPAGPFIVVTERLQAMAGSPMTTAIPSGERILGYTPRAGDELNLLIANLSGTADDHAAGEILMVDDGTGKLIATTGTPETEVAVLYDTITDPTADQLGWCQWSGY